MAVLARTAEGHVEPADLGWGVRLNDAARQGTAHLVTVRRADLAAVLDLLERLDEVGMRMMEGSRTDRSVGSASVASAPAGAMGGNR